VAVAEQRRVNAELEALWTSIMFVQDLVLGSAIKSSSLVASLAMVAEEVENRINTMTANGVWWGTRYALVAVMSHFPELEPKLELLGYGRDADLSDDQVDAIWPLVSIASDLLVSLIPSLLARGPPDDTE
jgi:hypothetical protein